MTKRNLDCGDNINGNHENCSLNEDHSDGLKKIRFVVEESAILEESQNDGNLSPKHEILEVESIEENENKIVSELQESSATVIHLRNLCPDISEIELIQLGFPFGKVKKLILLKAKNQGFLEFYDHQSMAKMLEFYANSQNETSLRGYKIYAQSSNHPHLNTTNIPPAAAASADSAILSLNSLYSANSTQEKPTHIIRIILDGCNLSIKIETLYQIFSKFGEIQKIVTFVKNNTFQAFVQYSSPAIAQFARMNLNGQKFFNGLCTIKIDFSKLNDLIVKSNNDKMRDYTQHPLGENERAYYNKQNTLVNFTQGATAVNVWGGKNYENIPITNLANIQSTIDIASPLGYSDIMNQQYAIIPSYAPGLAPISYRIGSMCGPGNIIRGIPYPMERVLTNVQGGDVLNSSQNDGTGCVLLINNLNEEKLTPDALFILFGVYGDVLRVKILYNRRDTALVQMNTLRQVQLAIINLDNTALYGKQIHVSLSKYQTIQIPKEMHDVTLSKDYSNSPLHRFKKLGSKNYNNIFRPSAVLHLSNIPAEMDEANIKNIFTESNFKILAFKFFQNVKKMALIQMEDTEEAISALIALHNYRLNDTHNLRVSFSKSTI